MLVANPFIIHHRTLLQLYAEAPARQEAGTLESDLDRIRNTVSDAQCADLLTAYERFLSLIALRLDAPDLPGRLTLLDSDRFESGLRRDPSQPFLVIGAALAHLKEGRNVRAWQLLRRLAGSQYPERKLAQRLLGDLAPDLAPAQETVA